MSHKVALRLSIQLFAYTLAVDDMTRVDWKCLSFRSIRVCFALRSPTSDVTITRLNLGDRSDNQSLACPVERESQS